jgi:hypothetical protein
MRSTPNIVYRKKGEAAIVARKLRGLSRRALDMRPVWPAVTERAVEGYKRAFDAQGPGWTPLKASTERRRIKEGFSPGPILVKTGDMRKSVFEPELEGGPDFMNLLANDPKLPFHMSGTKKMVARPIQLRRKDGSFMSQRVAIGLMLSYQDGWG